MEVPLRPTARAWLADVTTTPSERPDFGFLGRKRKRVGRRGVYDVVAARDRRADECHRGEKFS